jgi:hypothetical protein
MSNVYTTIKKTVLFSSVTQRYPTFQPVIITITVTVTITVTITITVILN